MSEQNGNIDPKQEERIRRAFKERDWNEIKSADSWAIFKVMSEFVEGFEKLSKIGPCVSIFGSARTPRDHKYYLMAEEIAAKLVRHGYGVITGGGPGNATTFLSQTLTKMAVGRISARRCALMR